MANPKISVIVPIYNSEKYLSRCVDSILAQTFTDFEVLLINDGSTDKSGIICDAYAKSDPRVRVFHKENGGVSSARNVGITNMIGEYSIHVDSDDVVSYAMLGDLYDFAISGNFDYVICDFTVTHLSKKTTLINQEPTNCNSIQVLCDILNGKLHGSVCNKLISNNLIKMLSVGFCNEINYCEDVLFNASILLHNISVGYLNKSYYNYSQNDSSITNLASFDQIKNLPTYLNKLDLIIKKTDNTKLNLAFNIHVLSVKYTMICSDVLKYSYIKNVRKESNGYISELSLRSASGLSLYSIIKGTGLFAKIINLMRKIKRFYKI